MNTRRIQKPLLIKRTDIFQISLYISDGCSMELITFPITIFMQTCYFQHIRSGIGLDIIPIQKDYIRNIFMYSFVKTVSSLTVFH